MMESLWSRRPSSLESNRAARPRETRPTPAARPASVKRAAPESTDYLRGLQASKNLLFAVKDLEGRYLEANDAYARALGREPAALLGRLDRDLMPADQAGELARRERLAMRGVVLKPELETFDFDGPAFVVERIPVRDAQGELRAVCLLGLESVAAEAGKAVAGAVAENPRLQPVVEKGWVELAPTVEVWLAEGAHLQNEDWDPALYDALLSRFCQRYERLRSGLTRRLETEAHPRLAKEIGRLAAGARSLGAHPLATAANALRSSLEEGENDLDRHTATFIRALDATILVMERRMQATADPLEWRIAGGQLAPNAESSVAV